MNKELLNIPVAVYGNFSNLTSTLSIGRCRLFYLGANRNGTYITEDFAEKLLNTIPYAPVKGIYENDDFTDHGKERSDGRIYGVVPENPNLSWEDHLDEDGVTRKYACVDVIIYTALYKEANDIIGKSQSMELYGPSIKGDWQYIEGKRMYVYTDASFLGLQALGDDTEPCFEGSAFFSLYTELKSITEKLEPLFQKNKKGGDTVHKLFKLSDQQKAEKLWNLLNPNYNKEGNWAVQYRIQQIYDDYLIATEVETDDNYRFYYEKNDETEEVSFVKKQKCYIVDVNEDEKKSLDTIKALNNNTFEKCDDLVSSINTLTEENAELKTQNASLEQSNSELQTNFDNANNTINTLNTQVAELTEYKNNTELAEKKKIISKYSAKLSSEVISTYTNNINEYSVDALDRELAYELVNSNPKLFNLSTDDVLIPQVDNEPESGINRILNKYKNK